MNDSLRLKSFNGQEQRIALKTAFNSFELFFQEQSYVFSEYIRRKWFSVIKKKQKKPGIAHFYFL